MKTLFLTSSVHAVAHDIVRNVDLSKGNRLVFIDTAAEPVDDDKGWLANDRKALFIAGFVVTDYSITNKSPDQLKKDLSRYEYIYMSGGDTSYLLVQAQKSGFVSLVQRLVSRENKTYIGTSAGSIIAGPIIPEYLFEEGTLPDSKKRRGFNFVNFTIVPHWGSEDFKEKYLNKRLKIAYKRNQTPLLLLTDNQYVLVKGNQMKIIDVEDKKSRWR